MIDQIDASCRAAASRRARRSRCIGRAHPCARPSRGCSPRAKTSRGVVTYIIDRNVNYTNICVARCNFCAFYRPIGSADGYVLGFEEIFRKIDETIAVGGNKPFFRAATIRICRSSGTKISSAR